MIVWVASFPRSGNTFLRIVLKGRYGVQTSVVYDIDGVAERLGSDLVGATERPAPIEELRASPEVHFVKTHRQADHKVDANDRAICLVRDGRDALVSWARLASEHDPRQYETELRAMIMKRDGVGTGSWGRNVLSWLQPPAARHVLLRYENLVATPEDAVDQAMSTLAPELVPHLDVAIPSLPQLQEKDGRFFRRGIVGSHRDELPDDLHRLFWSQPDNAAAMQLLEISETQE